MATRSYIAIEILPLVFTHADARAYGIADRQLYEWPDAAQIETLGRGIFIRPGLDVDHDLLEILRRRHQSDSRWIQAQSHGGRLTGCVVTVHQGPGPHASEFAEMCGN